MNLHGEIMNIHCGLGLSEIGATEGEQLAFKRGHKQARHAAAELALKADATIAELLAVVEKLVSARNKQADCLAFCIDCDAFIEDAAELLAKHRANIQSAEGTKP